MRNGTTLDHYFELVILRLWSINGATQQIDASDGLTPAADLWRWANSQISNKIIRKYAVYCNITAGRLLQ
jgi:hypothetical protein